MSSKKKTPTEILNETFITYLMGNFPIISFYTASGEVTRATDLLLKATRDFNKDISDIETDIISLKNHGFEFWVWDGYKGLIAIDNNNKTTIQENTVEPEAAISFILSDKANAGVYVFQNLHIMWEDPIAKTRLIYALKEFVREAPKYHKHIVMVGTNHGMPDDIKCEAVIMELMLPTREEITEFIKTTMDVLGIKVKQTEIQEAADISVGMTMKEVDMAIRSAIISTNGRSIDKNIIFREKKKAVKRSGLLELLETDENIETLAGLTDFKTWAKSIAHIFKNQEKARKFGLPNPKGCLLCGIPGTGKTLCAKVLANYFEVPLYRSDIGKLYAHGLGDTESNTREVIRLMESVSPCVILWDEAEKMLSGLGSSNYSDAGVTSRLISSLLYYLEEKTSLTYIVATANDITNIPPELMRKGRWDEIWFVDIPSDKAREEIIKIHLYKTGRQADKIITASDMKKLVDISAGYTGAEIESAIHDALRTAFLQGKEVTGEIIINSFKQIVPLTSTKKEEIEKLRAWASTRMRMADSAAVKKEIGVWAGAHQDEVITKTKTRRWHNFTV